MTPAEFQALRIRFRAWWAQNASHIKPVYWVGGALRDELLGRSIKDVDLCVEQEGGARQLADLLLRSLGQDAVTSFQMGAHYPIWKIVVTDVARSQAIFGMDRFEAEIADTQSESFPASDSRARMTYFSSRDDDCKRRDFTVNSLYWNVEADRLEDPSGCGRSDLSAKLLRVNPAVDPGRIFSEDPLRIIRLARFAATLDFAVDPITLAAAVQTKERLGILSGERIQAEFDRLIGAAKFSSALELLQQWGIAEWADRSAHLGTLEQARTRPGDPISKLNAEDWRVLEFAAWLRTGALSVEKKTELLEHWKHPRARLDRIVRLAQFRHSEELQITSPEKWRQIARQLEDDTLLAIHLEWAERGGPSDNRRDTATRALDTAFPLGRAAVRILRGDEIAALLKRAPGPWLTGVVELFEDWTQEFARLQGRAPTLSEAEKWVLTQPSSL